MKYRMRTFQSAFHANADQETWYGWGPLKETAVKIKTEDASLRAEAELEHAIEAVESGASAQGTPGFGATLLGAVFVVLAVLLRRRG